MVVCACIPSGLGSVASQPITSERFCVKWKMWGFPEEWQYRLSPICTLHTRVYTRTHTPHTCACTHHTETHRKNKTNTSPHYVLVSLFFLNFLLWRSKGKFGKVVCQKGRHNFSVCAYFLLTGIERDVTGSGKDFPLAKEQTHQIVKHRTRGFAPNALPRPAGIQHGF